MKKKHHNNPSWVFVMPDVIGIYHGKNNENWVKSKLFDSVKALGLGRKKDKNPTAVIVDSNKKVDLDLYFNKDNLILLKNQKVNKNSFKSFLNQLD